MIRALDLCFAFFGLLLLSPVLQLLWVIGWLDTGSPLFLQTRVGCHQKPFVLIKFRTMQPEKGKTQIKQARHGTSHRMIQKPSGHI